MSLQHPFPQRIARLLACGLLSATALLIAAPSVNAWGVLGHRYISDLAVLDLPAPLRELYAANRAWLSQHSSDPDLWRRDNSREGPHHFIDMDAPGFPPADRFPRDYWIACGLYGQDVVDKNGVVPWRIGQYYGKLVRAFRERNGRAIIENSAWLGHYAADIHVPFHATANYDGQLTGQRGIHARFESDLLEKQIAANDLKTMPARPLKDPVNSAFDWARASLKRVPLILAADKEAAARDANYGEAYYAAFGKQARPVAITRLQEGGRDLASLWLSAWIEAGRPELPTAADMHAGEPLDQPTHDPDLPARQDTLSPLK